MTLFYNFTSYTTSNGWIIAYDELGWMWKEVVTAYFTIICQYLLGMTEKDHEHSQPGWAVSEPRFEITLLIFAI
jgi:hypothetical protein